MEGNRYADRKGALLIVCAPSGAGKSTLVARLRREYPRIAFSVSCTTRAPREGEIDGVHYHFCSPETFMDRREKGYFAECAPVHGNWYGTPLDPLREMLDAGRDVLFDIDVQGAMQLRRSMPGGRYLFVFPPSLDVLEQRLRRRGTDGEDSIARRLAAAAAEIRESSSFDAWIVNDDLEQAYDAFRAFYLHATLDPALRPDLIRDLLEEDDGTSDRRP